MSSSKNSPINTVDGRNLTQVDRQSILIFAGFYSSQVDGRVSSIHYVSCMGTVHVRNSMFGELLVMSYETRQAGGFCVLDAWQDSLRVESLDAYIYETRVS